MDAIAEKDLMAFTQTTATTHIQKYLPGFTRQDPVLTGRLTDRQDNVPISKANHSRGTAPNPDTTIRSTPSQKPGFQVILFSDFCNIGVPHPKPVNPNHAP